MKYIYITKEAAEAFAASRFYQTCDYLEGRMLCDAILDKDYEWKSNRIGVSRAKNGLLFYTSVNNRNEALVFDLDTFKAFSDGANQDHVITIFQKIVKCAVRYFNNQPLGSSEQPLMGRQVIMVFPFPFEPSHDAYKVFLDKNSYNKRGKNLLLVFDDGNDKKIGNPSFTNLNKALNEIKDIQFSIPIENVHPLVGQIAITDLSKIDLKIDSAIGFDNWWIYLTKKQKDFIEHIPNGPERLEGGAGTGKTITLALKCIYLLKKAISDDANLNIIFFTHSSATCDRIRDILRNNWKEMAKHLEIIGEGRQKQSILITTLQEWCSTRLGLNQLSEAEFLDKDAAQSKEWQRFYIEEGITVTKQIYWSAFKTLCSPAFISIIEETPNERLVDIIQKEISEVIKGRAANSLEDYLQLQRTKTSLSLSNDSEKKFIYQIFDSYQNLLLGNNKYDTDDITISALGQLNTPIWNRRRVTDGYDLCVIDETQLFNLNEISIFHFVNTSKNKNNIIFALDKSQAMEDVCDAHAQLNTISEGQIEFSNKLSTVFRSSPDIAKVAYSILSSGVTLFADYENPLKDSTISFTSEEEKKCAKPHYQLCLNETEEIDLAFKWADNYRKEMGVQKSDILFVTTNPPINLALREYLKTNNKAVEWLEKRSDMHVISKAKSANCYLISSIDFIGGLEFSAVILLGVDSKNVPPKINHLSDHIFNYLWHNRLYVTVTRAKYAIAFFGELVAGPSPLLEDAINKKLISLIKPQDA